MLPAACIVPETSARASWVVPLVPVFPSLVHLCPFTSRAGSTGSTGSMMPREAALHKLVEEGRLLALSPPLPAKDTKRLQHLARSLNGVEAAEHGERLKQLILENLARKTTREETAALKEQLRGNAPSASEKEPLDLLWQERLLLLLADQADREEEELTAAFNRINKQHQELFNRLNEEANTGEALAELPAQLPPADPPGRSPWQPKRIKAWSRLLKRTALPRQDLWYITRQESLAAQIIEQYQSCTGREAIHLPALLVPGHDEEAENISIPANQLEGFPGLAESFARVQTIAADMSGLYSKEQVVTLLQEVEDLFAGHIPAWNAAMLGVQTGESRLCRLQLSLLPGMGFQQLLEKIIAGESAGSAGEKANAESAACGETANPALCLFGFLEEAQAT